MYLSRLILNPRSRQVRSEVGNAYELHRTLMRAFPGEEQGGPGRVLFRLERPRQGAQGGLTLLAQSEKSPDWGWLEQVEGYLLPGVGPNPAWKVYEPGFGAGQVLRFRLRANPTVKREGKRHGLYREEEQREWLVRKADAGGFRLLAGDLVSEGQVQGKILKPEQEGHRLSLLAVCFEGVLQVIDPARFEETIRLGVGSGKGFGFGLLSVAREG